MTGMVNPNPAPRLPRERETQKPDTMSNRLERLGKNESGSVKVDKDGRITEGGLRMNLSRGLHWFGIGKPKDDIETNKQTLDNVVTLLHQEAKQMMIEQNKQWKEGDFEKHWHVDPDTFATKVMDSLLKSTTYLEGDSKLFGKTDPGYTLKERHDRGTYLTGDLARQIKQRFDEITRGTIDKRSGQLIDLDEKVARERAEARRRGANFEIFGGTNQDSVRRFLGQEVKNEGILPSLINAGASLVDGLKGAFDRLTGTESRNTAFESTLQQIREQGTKPHPSDDTAFWDAFEEHWTRAMSAPKNSIEGMEFAFVERKLEQYANQMAREGKIVDEKMISGYLTRLLTNGQMMGRIGDLRNHNYVSHAKVEDIAKAIETWRDQQPLEVREQISQNDCEWLAREIQLSQEGERLLRERAPNIEMSIKDWGTDLVSFDKTYEKFSSSNVLSKIYETMAKNYGEMEQPYFMTGEERKHHYFTDREAPKGPDVDNAIRKHTDDRVQGLVKHTRHLINLYNPPEWGPETLARLMDDSIKDVLIDRHQRMEQHPKMRELRENRESREILQQNLEPFPLLKLQAQRYMDHPEVIKHNPTKPSEFIAAIVSDPIIYARTYAEMHRQIMSGQWKSELGPEPPQPKEGAPRKEVEQYEHDKRVYEQKAGKEHERFMKESIRVREIERQVTATYVGQFQALDEVQQGLQELEGVDLQSLSQDKEEMERVGREIDEMRQKVSDMWSNAFNLINDSKNNMEITDQQARDILGAVMAGWCDLDAKLNMLELELGRAQFEIGQLLEAPKLESSNQALRETDTNLRHALEDSLKALESGDRKKMERTSDELKRQLVSAFGTAFPLYLERGPDEPQAGQLLELIRRATRVSVELERTPQLREGRLGIEGWDNLVRDLLPAHLDRVGARNDLPSYERMRTTQEDTRRNEISNRNYLERVEKGLGELPPTPPSSPGEKLPWMSEALHGSLAPFPTLQRYVSQLRVAPEDTTTKSSQTINKLFEGTVFRPLVLAIQQEVQQDKKIRTRDKDRIIHERQKSFEKRWDEKIQPGLIGLDDYKPLPPLPEKLDLETTVQYRKTLTQYIDSMTRLQNSLQVSKTELSTLGKETRNDQQRMTYDRAGFALEHTRRELVAQIDLAQQRLKILQR